MTFNMLDLLLLAALWFALGLLTALVFCRRLPGGQDNA